MSAQETSLSSKVIYGTFWTIGMRWATRMAGLVSMAIVARLLSPDDFGIVAVAVALTGLMNALTDFGADTTLIRHPNPGCKHYNTIWTFTICVHLLSAWLVALTGYFSPTFYSDARYEAVLYAMSLSIIIAGLSNIGIVSFRKNFNYQKDFQLVVVTQLIGVLATIALAYYLRSYWALVLGGLIRSITKTWLSYAMHPFRPKVSLAAHEEMFGFSFWIMVRSIATFLTNKADRLLLAVYFSPRILGFYAIASELAEMAVFELLFPISRALLPALATKQDDKAWLEKNIQKIFNINATVAIAIGLGLASVASPALELVYGQQYLQAAPMLALLAVLNIINGLNQPVAELLLLMKRAKFFSLFSIAESVITLITIYVLASGKAEFEVIIYSRVFVAFLGLSRIFYLLRVFENMTLFMILKSWFRPMLAGLAMFSTLEWLQQHLVHLPTFWVLAALIVSGALVYGIILLVMWYITKKPDGIEFEVVSRFRQKFS